MKKVKVLAVNIQCVAIEVNGKMEFMPINFLPEEAKNVKPGDMVMFDANEHTIVGVAKHW